MRIFDYNTFTLGITFLLVGSLLTSCLCAQADPWWYNACNSPTTRMRHGRSIEQEHINTQLRIFNDKLNNNISKDLAILYSDVNKTRTQFRGRLPWLKLTKMVKRMKEPAKKLPEFHQALQLFAGTLTVLNQIQINASTQFKNGYRAKIYDFTTDHLKLLLCEVEDAINQNNGQVPAGIPLSRMGVQRLPKSMDLTGVYLLDTNFFKKMKTFFRRSQPLFRIKKKNKRRLINKSEPKKSKRT